MTNYIIVLKGISACPGVVEGEVKIIQDVETIKKIYDPRIVV